MSRRAQPTQKPLPGVRRSRTQGTVERHAGADLRVLKSLEVLPPGSDALQSAYRLIARELDNAEREADRYGKINTARELLRIRKALAPDGIREADDSLDRFLAALPESPRGHPSEPGPA